MKRTFSLVLVAALAVIGLVACRPPKPPVYVCAAEAGPASDPVAATATADADEPLAPEQAGEEAKVAFAESDVQTPDGRVPIVTVEDGPNGPEIVSTPVASEAEAETVAEAAAADGDLVVVEPDSVVTADADPNDEFFDQQYAFDFMPFVKTWQRNAPDNFSGKQAGAGQVVAIIDTGVQASHPDLNDGRVRAGYAFLPPGPATQDLNGHGTRLAGTVAARTNNNERGIAGGAPAAEILPVKVLDQFGRGPSSTVAQGILWAADNGATVINLSLGGDNPSQAQQLAIQHALYTRGIPVIASSGNRGKCGSPSYPAAFPEVLAVAAVNESLVWANFSTTAPYVNVAAPGDSILSTCPTGTSATCSASPMGYNTSSGTSFAAPYVSAVAALVRARHPSFTANEVYVRIINSAIDLPPAIGWDPETGFGLVDPFRAVYGLSSS